MIFGNKVVLAEIDQENIEWMRQQRNDPEMRRYFREWKDISKDQQLNWYKTRGNNSDPNHVYFQIMSLIGSSEPGPVIGCCGLHYIDWRLRSAEFGIFISKDSRGSGCGKEALKMLFDYGFDEINLHKIWAEVYGFNQAKDLYVNLGMKEDGVLRHNCFHGGKYYDSVILSILESEWGIK